MISIINIYMITFLGITYYFKSEWLTDGGRIFFRIASRLVIRDDDSFLLLQEENEQMIIKTITEIIRLWADFFISI